MRSVQKVMTNVLEAMKEKKDAPGASDGNIEESTCGMVSPITTCGGV